MFLSKSDYMMAYDCVKALWLKKNRQDLIVETDSKQQTIFDTGNEIQEVARKYFKDGILVEAQPWDVVYGSSLTKEMCKKYDVLFEAFAKIEWGAFCRIDVIKKNGKGWDLIEIKGSNSLKDEHIDDLAFQYYVFTNAGYEIKDCYVMHLNKDYVFQKKLNIKKLFSFEKVTNEVAQKYSEVEELAPRFFDAQKQKAEPQINLCKNCLDCQFFHYCGKEVPKYSIFNILRNPKADKIYKQRGNATIKADILEHCNNTAIIDVQCFLNNKENVDKTQIKEFLDSLEYPLYYLDYETFQPPIPMFENSGTYNQIPFQFSLHIQEKKDGDLKHLSFLHKEKSDLRREIAEALVKSCGKQGSIVVYNESFEKTRNKELASLFPDLKKDLLAINKRVVDLLIPFKQRALYHHEQKSSASIKAVLPAFTNLSYDKMEVKNGGQAMDRYLAFMNDKLSKQEEIVLFKGLEDYCCQDTIAMVELIKVLYNKSS